MIANPAAPRPFVTTTRLCPGPCRSRHGVASHRADLPVSLNKLSYAFWAGEKIISCRRDFPRQSTRLAVGLIAMIPLIGRVRDSMSVDFLRPPLFVAINRTPFFFQIAKHPRGQLFRLPGISLGLKSSVPLACCAAFRQFFVHLEPVDAPLWT